MFSQGVAGALTVLMKDTIKPNLMQTLEVEIEIILKYANNSGICFIFS